MTADLEEELRKGRWRGVKIREKRVCSLAYADDVVVLAEREDEMESMMRRLERYFEEKKLQVNAGKTKMMRFRKGDGRYKEGEWRWRGERIEEVKEFKSLGYVFNRNREQEAHIRDRVRKAGIVMEGVWGIGKRKFGNDWSRKMWPFDTFVWTVMGYGVGTWGWQERKEAEGMQERYIRWTLGVDWRTPGYMVREEAKRDTLRIRAKRRAWRYEGKLRKGEGSEIARECLAEMGQREEEMSKWERERKKGRKGRQEGKEAEGYEEIEKEDRNRQKRDRKERIRKSEYNRWYRETITDPMYLRKSWSEERCRRIARFRLGNEMGE